MKIGLIHRKGAQTESLVRQLIARLPPGILSWTDDDEPPATDIRVLLALAPVARALLARQAKLEIVQTASAGYDSVDVEAASEMGIWVSNAPAGLTGNAASVAEFAVMLLIGAARHLASALSPPASSASAVAVERRSLRGRTVCIVGLGSIGRHLVERLRPFGVTLVGTNHALENPPADMVVHPAAALHAAVADADFVVICVPGSPHNRSLIDTSVLDAMKMGAILVNIARGSVVDEAALCAALRSGRISAVGLDVLTTPPSSRANPLFEFAQALITPHIAGDTDLTATGTVAYLERMLRQWGAGLKPESIINAPAHPRRFP